MLDFKKLKEDGDDFEFLCADVLESLGNRILERPSKGPDGKKDILIEVKIDNSLGSNSRDIYLVQCKHKAHSSKSVYERELGDWRSACRMYNANGYMLITDSTISVSVANALNATNSNPQELKTLMWDKSTFEDKILESPKAKYILNKYSLLGNRESNYEISKKLIDSYNNIPFKHKESNQKILYSFHVYYEEIDKYNKEMKIEKKIINHIFVFCNSLKAVESKKDIQTCEGENRFYYFYDDLEETMNGSMNIEKLHNFLDKYKDEYYQLNTMRIINTYPKNSIGIFLLVSIFENSRYSIPETLYGILHMWLELDLNEKTNVMFIHELLRVIQIHQIFPLAPKVYELVINIQNSNLEGLYKSQLSLTAIKVLAELDVRNKFIELIDQLFDKSKNIEFKVNCIQYYKIKKSNYMLNKAKELQSKYGLIQINQMNAINYDKNDVRILENKVKTNVHNEINKYLILYIDKKLIEDIQVEYDNPEIPFSNQLSFHAKLEVNNT